jgi:hypothetical protein
MDKKFKAMNNFRKGHSLVGDIGKLAVVFVVVTPHRFDATRSQKIADHFYSG